MKQRIIAFMIILVLPGCANNIKSTTVKMFHWDFVVDTNSPIYQKIKERTGIEIEPISAPWTDWPNKLNIMLASGDVPDIFVTYGPGDADVYEKLVKEAMLLPISRYFDRYPNLRKRLSGWERQKIGNEYYAIPVYLTIDHTFFIRKDWLAECGLSIPKTLDDLYITAKAFREKYNIYPITSSPPHTSGFFWLNPIFFAFNGGWEIWINENGKYIPSWISNGNKKALEFIWQLYNEKLIDPEFFSNTDNHKVEKFINSKAGIMMHTSYPQIKRELFKINPNAQLAIFGPLKGPEGYSGMWSLDGFFTAVSISAKLDETKRNKVLGFLDYLYSLEGLTVLRYGIRGVHWDLKENKKIPLLPLENELVAPLENIDKTAGLRVFAELGGVWYPEWEKDWDTLNQITDTARQYGVADKFLYSQTESAKEYNKRLYDITMKHYVQMIKSGDIDRKWELYVNEFLSAGGDKVIEERNRYAF